MEELTPREPASLWPYDEFVQSVDKVGRYTCAPTLYSRAC